MSPCHPPILPGQTVGILGGGQLGRMFAIAARRLGYRVHSFDPARDAPAGQVADVEVIAAYDDLDAARRFADAVDVVTFEFENIPAETLAAIAEIKPVHPSAEVLHVCRHRLREKEFLKSQGFPVAAYRAVHSGADLRQAVQELGTPAILKTADFGYDGKGQTRIDRPDAVEDAWRQLGRPAGVVEAFVPFTQEMSVICARAADGAERCFGPVDNVHVRHILDVTTVPAQLPAATAQAALDLARAITESLHVVGLLAVEMFVVGDQILVNELAPRPHNSGHYSIDACVTNQFEQQLRAVCGLPLGDVRLLRPAAMANLLGDLWQSGEPNWPAALAFPDVKLHLYGKAEPRPGRKMGHLTALAETAEQARAVVLAARAALPAPPLKAR
ncbi:MAG: 5-(carboxyamino)imidazole ribonucleotide synthase [Gemmataceae bacterium]|nr:5-(carboxyamino)imidazole ribonucleotide synthase [Gemmataceae bacterium]